MFKNLKSLFVKEDEVKPAEPPHNDVNDQPITEENISAETIAEAEVQHQAAEEIVDVANVDVTGEVSEKFMNILLGAINKNNQEGFDYIEFKQSLQSLANMDMDEKTKIQSAFAMAKTMGATQQRLVETANYYLGILAKESQKFESAVSSQISKQVGSKKTRAKDIELSIKNKTKQIEQLTKEIESLKIDQEKTSKEIASSQVKVLKTKNDFLSTYELLKQKINKDIALIKQYTS